MQRVLGRFLLKLFITFVIIVLLLFKESHLFDRRGSVIADMELTFNRTVGEHDVDALMSEAIKSDGKLGNIDAVRGEVGSTLEGDIAGSYL